MTDDAQLAYRAGTAQGRPKRPGWPGRLLALFQRRRDRRHAAQQLYRTLVEQARQPVFYAAWAVPDSRDGRLQLVSIHAILLMRRLRDEGQAGQALAQRLFDLMFEDLDRHLREWGVGDLSVGKHAKKLAQSFLGLAAALDPVLAEKDRAGLEVVLRRNVYSEIAAPQPLAVSRLADYVLEQSSWLDNLAGAQLLDGHLRFAPVSES